MPKIMEKINKILLEYKKARLVSSRVIAKQYYGFSFKIRAVLYEFFKTAPLWI